MKTVDSKQGDKFMLEPLFDNHVAFIDAHRGHVTRDSNGTNIISDAPGFASWIPSDDAATLPQTCTAVRLMPWSGRGWPQRLSEQAFTEAEELSYMELLDPRPVRVRPNAEVNIHVVTDESDADEFASVQSVAFLDDSSPSAGWWRKFFQKMARRNFNREDQTFYIARLRGIAAAVTLVVRTSSISGIYAVATRPVDRNKGLSTALLARAVDDIRKTGASRVALQAMTGSYAEGLYRRLSFVTKYRARVYRPGER